MFTSCTPVLHVRLKHFVQDRPLVHQESSTIEEQLSVTDATDVNETFLSQRAHVGGLERFQFMIQAPSFEDQCAEMARSFVGPLELERLIFLFCNKESQFNQVGCHGRVASAGRPREERSRLCEERV